MSTRSTEEIVLQKHYAELVKLLARCIDDVVLGLVSMGVIDIDQKNVIRKYGDTPGDKVQYLLDNHIARPLSGGVTDHFMKLLDAMKEFSSCDLLVGAIEEDLLTGDAKVKDPLSSSEDDVESSLEEISKRQEYLDEKIEHLQEEIHGLHIQSDSEKSGKETLEESIERLLPENRRSDQPTCSVRDYCNINEQGVAVVIDQYGSSNEQLNSPHLLARRPDGGLICRNSSNQHVILFDEQLQCLHVIGEKGDGNGKFQDISGIAASETCLYVADSVLNSIQKFELTGKFVCQFGSEGEKRGQFNGPSGLLLLKSDLLFICDRYNHRIQVFRNDEFSYTFGESGTEPGTFSRPVDLSVNRTGDQLFITDSDNNRVQVFTPKGDFVRVFGNSVDIPFELQIPFGICVTPDDHVLITAVGTHSLLVFKDDGTFVSAIEGTYQGESRYSYPCGAVMMNNGQIVIADYYGNKLVVF